MTNDRRIHLTPQAQEIVAKGGDDDISDDQMLLMEIAKRAPGMLPDELQRCFIAIRMEYGEESLRAIRTGHVQFEERKPQ